MYTAAQPSPQKVLLYLLAINPHSHRQSWEPLICFLCLWFSLFQKLHINGIIQYVVFCVWFLSLDIKNLRFLYIVACTYILFLFNAKKCSIFWICHNLFIHLSSDCFKFLALANNTATNNCTQVFVWKYVFIALG